MPEPPRLVRQAFTGEVSWHVLQHNRAYSARHDEDSEELGLAPTYGEFPSAHPAWQDGAAAVDRRLRQRLARVRARTISADSKAWEPNDLQHALDYLAWEPWSLAEMPLAEFVHTVRSNAWGALRDLTLERVARFVDGYKSDERQGHENILALLDRDGQFEPIVLIHDAGRLVYEGNHRTLAACHWSLAHPNKNPSVRVYYPCVQAKSLNLP